MFSVADYLTFDKIGKILQRDRPDIVCIGFLFPYMQRAEKLIALVNNILPKTATIIGGVGVTYCPELALRKTGADFAIIGEGERPLINLIDMLQEEDPSYLKDNNISGGWYRGITYIDSNNDFIGSGPSLILPFDEIPMPNWDKFPMHWYMRTGAHYFKSFADGSDRVISWMASRGCWGKCNFCCDGCEPRIKPMGLLEQELREIHKLFNPIFLYWMDNLGMYNKGRCIEFCEMLMRNGFTQKYFMTGRVDVVDEEVLKYLKDSGCVCLLYGVESGNDTILKRMGKNITVGQIERAIRITKEAGIGVNLSAMFGQPGETVEDWKETMRLILLASDWQHPTHNNQGFMPLTTFPGSRIYEWAKHNNYIGDDSDFYDKFFGRKNRWINYTQYPDDQVLYMLKILGLMNERNYYKHQFEWHEKYLDYLNKQFLDDNKEVLNARSGDSI